MYTNLFFIANIMVLACSAAFPTIGSRITLIKATGKLNDSDAPCYKHVEKAWLKFCKGVELRYHELSSAALL
jgi:hypothetical protein